ncbi:MAG: hypothetical protein LUQ25_07035 [Methanoregulaceae archaeon]|nr:hypothetical protein [Methanoregulaceae archaeon]
MSMIDAYIGKMNAQLAELKAEIEVLKAKAMKAHADTRIRYEKEIAELEKMRDDLQKQLDIMVQKGEKAFDELKGGADSAMKEMKTAVERAIGQLK